MICHLHSVRATSYESKQTTFECWTNTKTDSTIKKEKIEVCLAHISVWTLDVGEKKFSHSLTSPFGFALRLR